MDTYFDGYDSDQEQTKPEITPDQSENFEMPVLPEIEKNEKKHKKPVFWVLATVALVVVSCLITAVVIDTRWQKKMELSNKVQNNKIDVLQEQIEWMTRVNTENTQESALQGNLTPGQVYAQNVPAVVAISSQGTTTNIYGQVSQTASAGSGFLISADGYVVTNYHVVDGATSLSVLTYDGEVHTAQIVGYDDANDVCILKIQGEDFPYVTLGSSDALGVGDQVAAIGNPLGELTSTLTVGYISAKDRVVATDGSMINMLQTDAAINSGNSGGPLFNMKGEVVGITTAKYSGTTQSGAAIEGIGFAIPMDDVVDMIRDLQEHGYIRGAYLGVKVMDVSESAQMYGLPAGAYVDEVTAGTAAERAGIQKQDIIINLGGYKIASITDLTRALRKLSSGETTTVTVYRSGQQLDLKIVLDEKPNETASPIPEEEPIQKNENEKPNGFPGGIFDFFFGD